MAQTPGCLWSQSAGSWNRGTPPLSCWGWGTRCSLRLWRLPRTRSQTSLSGSCCRSSSSRSCPTCLRTMSSLRVRRESSNWWWPLAMSSSGMWTRSTLRGAAGIPLRILCSRRSTAWESAGRLAAGLTSLALGTWLACSRSRCSGCTRLCPDHRTLCWRSLDSANSKMKLAKIQGHRTQLSPHRSRHLQVSSWVILSKTVAPKRSRTNPLNHNSSDWMGTPSLKAICHYMKKSSSMLDCWHMNSFRTFNNKPPQEPNL